MFESLSSVLNSANAEKLNLTISRGNLPEHICVTVQTIFHPANQEPDEAQNRLRANLSTPIKLEGYAGEVDVQFESVFLNYLDKAQPEMERLSVSVPSVISESVQEAESDVDTPTSDETDFTSEDAGSL